MRSVCNSSLNNCPCTVQIRRGYLKSLYQPKHLVTRFMPIRIISQPKMVSMGHQPNKALKILTLVFILLWIPKTLEDPNLYLISIKWMHAVWSSLLSLRWTASHKILGFTFLSKIGTDLANLSFWALHHLIHGQKPNYVIFFSIA